MNKLAAILFNSLPLILIGAWHHFGSSGALNIALFMVWVVLFPVGIMMVLMVKTSQKPPVLTKFLSRWIVIPIRWATLAVLVWFGFWVTGAAYLFHMACVFADASRRAEKAQEEPA